MAHEAGDPSRRSWWPPSPATIWLVALAALVVVIPAATVVWLTSDGIGATPDGSVYLGTARNLVAGEGLTSPISAVVDSIPPRDAATLYGRSPLLRWPPGVPVVLAAGSFATGADAAAVARVVSVLAISVNAVLTLLLARRWTGSTLVGAGCALVVATEPYHLMLHSLVASEPLYVTATLVCVLAADTWVRTQGTRVLVVAAVAAGAGWLLRFTGAGLLGALGLTVLVLSRRRLRDAAIVAAAGLPAVAWLAVTEASPYREAHRRSRTLPDTEIDTMLDTVHRWYVTGDPSTGVRTVLLVVVAAAVIGGAVALGRRAILPGVLVVAHTVIVVGSAIFVRELPVGGRMLVPIAAIVVCLSATGAVAGVRALTRRTGPRVAAGAVAAVGVLLLGLGLRHEWKALDALEPAAQPVLPADLAAVLDDLPHDVVLFSNDATGLYLATDRPAASVPARRWQESDVPNDGFPDEVDDLVAMVRAGEAAVVIYPGAAFFDDALLTGGELQAEGLEVRDLGGVTVAVGPQ